MIKNTNRKSYVKLTLDLLMGITFALLYNKMVLGGLAFHEIAGIAIAFAFILHVLLNIQWVKKVTLRLFDRSLPGKTRFGYVLNVLLLISMTFIIASGLLISKVVLPHLRYGNESWFKISHISVSFLTLILIGIHVGLHWHWVIHVSKRLLKLRVPKLLANIMVKTAAVLIIAFGSYQMYSIDMLSKLRSIGVVFNITSPQMPPQGAKQRTDIGEWHEKAESRVPASEAGSANAPHGERPMGGPEGGLRGGIRDANFLKVIATYLGIMAVFAAIAYYLDKWGNAIKRKRLSRI